MPDLNLRSPTVPLRPAGADGFRVPRPDYDFTLSYGRESRRAFFKPLADVADALIKLQMHQSQTEAEAVAQQKINAQQEQLNQEWTQLQTLKMQDAIEGGKQFKERMNAMIRKQNEEDTNSPPIVRNAVQKASDELRLNYGSKVDAYVMQETFNFKNNEMLSAIELTTNDLITNYNNPVLRQKYTQKLINQQGMQLDFNGINKGTKAYEVGIMNALDKAHDTVITDMINIEKFGEAKSAIAQAFDGGQMTAATRNDLLARLFNAEQSAHTRALADKAYMAQIRAAYKPLQNETLDAFLQSKVKAYMADKNNWYRKGNPIVVKSDVKKALGTTVENVLQGKAQAAPLVSTQVDTDKIVGMLSEEEVHQNAMAFAVTQANLFNAQQQMYKSVDNATRALMVENGTRYIQQHGKMTSPEQMFNSKRDYQAALYPVLINGGSEESFVKMMEAINAIGDYDNADLQFYFDQLKDNPSRLKQLFPNEMAFNATFAGNVSTTQYNQMKKDWQSILGGNYRKDFKTLISPSNMPTLYEDFGISVNDKGKYTTSVDSMKGEVIQERLGMFIQQELALQGKPAPTNKVDLMNMIVNFSLDVNERAKTMSDLNVIDTAMSQMVELADSSLNMDPDDYLRYSAAFLKTKNRQPYSTEELNEFIEQALKNPYMVNRIGPWYDMGEYYVEAAFGGTKTYEDVYGTGNSR